MSVEEAEARLALEKVEAAWVKAKQSGKKDAAYLKAQAALLEARDTYRNNYRTGGPGTASPAPLSVSLEVN